MYVHNIAQLIGVALLFLASCGSTTKRSAVSSGGRHSEESAMHAVERTGEEDGAKVAQDAKASYARLSHGKWEGPPDRDFRAVVVRVDSRQDTIWMDYDPSDGHGVQLGYDIVRRMPQGQIGFRIIGKSGPGDPWIMARGGSYPRGIDRQTIPSCASDGWLVFELSQDGKRMRFCSSPVWFRWSEPR